MQEKIADKYLLKNFIHDIASPLTTIRLSLDTLQNMLSTSENPKGTNLIRRTILGLEQLYTIVQAAQDEALDQEKTSEFSAAAELENIMKILWPKAMHHNITVKMDISEDLKLSGKTSKFRRAILNIINNAIEALVETAKQPKLLTISTKKSNDVFRISINDNGNGIRSVDLKKILNYQYTTKKHGSGIGLTEAREFLAEFFRAELVIVSKYKQGTKVTISFPQYFLLAL
ncbi:MAG TPA: HAMP domain-containing sensor histidine kinase [Candidatus Dojkabacteria bacterium]|nr:HAMP domain-containing sensor histidine kinase [Candidatus Dojkabacteria bacterium]